MKLGAQLFSIRDFIQTPEDTRRTFRRMADIGYENVQFSGGGPIPAQTLREIVDETGMEIAITHTDQTRILQDTDAVIAEHKLFRCPVIGMGMMPKEFRGSQAGFDAFKKALETPVKKILDAGLHFAYHNHAFELQKTADGGERILDRMLDECPDWQIILDVCWVQFGGGDVLHYLEKAGGARLANIHYKDMLAEPVHTEGKADRPDFVPCGEGVLDFVSITKKCEALGVKNVFVEQDNAVNKPDPFDEMARSFRNLRPIIAKEA